MLKARNLAFVASVTAAVSVMLPACGSAAELPLPAPLARVHHTAFWCGECGCLHKSYVYHRELRSTYGTSFDPRNFDQTEPHFFFGRMRAYPRYWVDADAVH
jgi:hypothetical protein